VTCQSIGDNPEHSEITNDVAIARHNIKLYFHILLYIVN
jgi:hypothetical protein